jgi:hypothetical protein
MQNVHHKIEFDKSAVKAALLLNIEKETGLKLKPSEVNIAFGKATITLETKGKKPKAKSGK